VAVLALPEALLVVRQDVGRAVVLLRAAEAPAAALSVSGPPVHKTLDLAVYVSLGRGDQRALGIAEFLADQLFLRPFCRQFRAVQNRAELF
jgi:hypothetical protein